MTTPHDGSTRITGPSTVGHDHDRGTEHRTTGTTSGADVTSRMTGTSTLRPTGAAGHGVTHAKTSAAATFGLVFGLAALFCALTAILAPAAVLFGVIGLVLAVVGLKMAKRVGVTGRGVAIGGLVTSVLGLLLGGAVLAGIASVVNSESALNRIENTVNNLRADLPSTGEVRNQIEGQ